MAQHSGSFNSQARCVIETTQVVGEYRLIREIGHGGMGVVYLAEDTGLCREVALKFIHPSLANDAAFIERFQREAQHISRANHPHLVHINSFKRFPDDRIAIDMEYVSGGSLSDRIMQGPLPPVTVIQYATEILQGLSVCHALGIVHRDLKPSNILLDDRGHVKISDFGLSTAYAEHLETSVYRVSSTSFFVGTPRFAPPEAWESEQPQPHWDVYSLGVLLFEALTGRALYDGSSPLAIVRQLSVGPAPSVSQAELDVSPELARLIDRMISRNGEERPEDAIAAMRALEDVPEYSDIGPLVAPTIAFRKPRYSRGMRRRRVPIRGLVAAIVGVACLAAGALALWSGNLPNTPTVSERQSVSDNEGAAVTSAAPGTDIPLLAFRALGDSPSRSKILMYAQPLSDGGYRLWGQWDHGLFHAVATGRTEGGLAVTGHWAAYKDRHGRNLGYGTVRGELHGVGSREFAVAQLQAQDMTDNTETIWNLNGEQIAAAITPRTDFWRRFEKAEWLSALLHTEMLPRGLDWAAAVELELPSESGQRLDVPATGSDGIQVDGLLNETVWSAPYYDDQGPIGALAPASGEDGAEIIARLTDAGVAIAVRAATIREPDLFRIAVQRDAGRPRSLTTRHVLAISPDGAAHSSLLVGDREQFWQADWLAAATHDQETWRAEILIPLIDARELIGETWRLNAQVVVEEASGDVTRWGGPSPTDTWHGVVVTFVNPSNP